MKLTIEPIPEPTWFLNLRKLLKGSVWDTIRQSTYARFFYHCYVCGRSHWDEGLKEGELNDSFTLTGGGLHAHEWWVFDDDTGTQYLQDVVALCPSCHSMKHIVFTISQIKAGKLQENKVISHYCEVNRVLPNTFAKELEVALLKYEERSERKWVVDIGGFLRICEPHFWGFVKDGLLTGVYSDALQRYINDSGGVKHE